MLLALGYDGSMPSHVWRERSTTSIFPCSCTLAAPVPAVPTRRILAHLPQAQLALRYACAPQGSAIEDVAFPALLRPRPDLAGGFVVVDPEGWHIEAVTNVAQQAAENGARLVLYSELTRNPCRHVLAAAEVTVPEVLLRNSDDAMHVLRAALGRDVASVPAQVLAGVVGRLVVVPHPIGSRLASYLAWASIPGRVRDFCEAVGLRRKAVLARLHKAGFNDTEVVLEVARVARACDLLLGRLTVGKVARQACFCSERAMRDAFGRRLGATPSDVRQGRDAKDAARRLIVAATPPST